MTRDQADLAVSLMQAEQIKAESVGRQAVVDGDVVWIFSAVAKIRDAQHGNVIIRDLPAITAPTEATKIAKEMRREMRDRAKSMRAHVAAERAANAT